MKYRPNKERTIKNGTTTIVTGQGDMSSIQPAIYELVAALAEFNSDEILWPVTKGVAKLAPGDEYDADTGVKVATRKAELKARKRAVKGCVNVLGALAKFRATVSKELDDNINRCGQLKTELETIGEEPTEEPAE